MPSTASLSAVVRQWDTVDADDRDVDEVGGIGQSVAAGTAAKDAYGGAGLEQAGDQDTAERSGSAG
jgi:hypothetical protein